MLTESQKRAAALAVTRYGLDRSRVQAAALTLQRASVESTPTDLIEVLVQENLLNPSQAEELRNVLLATGIDRAPAPPQKTVLMPKDADEPSSWSTSEPRRLGKYHLLRRLGEGGMGSVYLGYQEGRTEQVAIKVLPDHMANNQSYVARFHREAKSVAHLDHPNIVRGIEVGQDAATGKHYLVLEYVDGPSAHALLDRFGRLEVGDAVHIVLDIARALEHAHSRNIVHRDIKPDNILLTSSGVAKLADLGLAKRMDEQSHLTGTRQAFGTPHYMPYEQALNAKAADGRSDIYALGATLYHLLTAEVPFPGKNPLEQAEKKDIGRFVPAGTLNPKVPPELDAILAKMMARHPRHRYQTASELIVDLERAQLAAPVLSFVDPKLALRDPFVRARLTSTAEPTQAALPTPAKKVETGDGSGVWYLRYRNSEGKLCKARASTQQILERLREGRLNRSVEASREVKGLFQPLPEFAEFQAAFARVTPPPSDSPSKLPPVIIKPPLTSDPRPRRRFWFFSLGLLLASMGIVTYWFYSPLCDLLAMMWSASDQT